MQTKRVSKILKTLPNKLTFIRISVIPILILLYPWDFQALRVICAIMFSAAAATDFFDGYIARRYNGVTPIGTILDPISDKLLFASVIILLCSTGQVPAWIAILLIGREIAVSGLRLAANEYKLSIRVSQLGKLKTSVQGLAILLLMLSTKSLHSWGMTVLWISMAISYVSAYQYWRELWSGISKTIESEQTS